MPFEMASTPVSAVVPLEKAWSKRKRLKPWSAPRWAIGGGSGTPGSVPAIARASPTRTMRNMSTMKK